MIWSKAKNMSFLSVIFFSNVRKFDIHRILSQNGLYPLVKVSVDISRRYSKTLQVMSNMKLYLIKLSINKPKAKMWI